eukprot:1440922-Pleurochrysis_carterae.AAC.3
MALIAPDSGTTIMISNIAILPFALWVVKCQIREVGSKWYMEATEYALIALKVGHRQAFTAIYVYGEICGISLATRSDASDRQL